MKKLTVIILLVVTIFSLSACTPAEEQPIRQEDIQAICELATLECYYNNVAKIEKTGNFFQKDREMWIEYEGKAVIGIKMSDVIIQITDDTVNITMPKATILSTDLEFNEKSYVSSTDGWLIKNEISTEEQQEGILAAQNAMREAIQNNTGLFIKAEARAKELIENYITKLGQISNREYTINWIN